MNAPNIWFPTSASSSEFLEHQSRRERERCLYFAMVTGTHYRTKTPPDQQPANRAQGTEEDKKYLQGFQVWSLKCAARFVYERMVSPTVYSVWWCVVSGGVNRGWFGRSVGLWDSWVGGFRFCGWWTLWGCVGSLFLEGLASSDEFG